MAFTPQKRLFAEQYLVDLNATQAAIRAGYSLKTAHSQGPRLLDDVDVKNFITEAMAKRSEETKIDAAWVLKRLAEEAEADMADLYDEHGVLKPVKDWPLIWRKGLVAGVDVEQLFEGNGSERSAVGVVTKIKLSDRVRRLELVGKHIGVQAFKDQVEHSGTVNLADRMSAARKRTNGAQDA